MSRQYIAADIAYPRFVEPGTEVTAVTALLLRLSDGFYYDFDDATFKDSGWTTKEQALTEKTEGVWVWTTGFAIPAGKETYAWIYKPTDGSDTWVSQGEELQANYALNTNGGAVAIFENDKKKVGDSVWRKADRLTVLRALKKLLTLIDSGQTIQEMLKLSNNEAVSRYQQYKKMVESNKPIVPDFTAFESRITALVNRLPDWEKSTAREAFNSVLNQTDLVLNENKALREDLESLKKVVNPLMEVLAKLLPDDKLNEIIQGGP